MPPEPATGARAPAREEVAGVLLAGGLAKRMGGGDKSLRELAGRPLLARIVERVRSQVGPLVLNANGDPARFAAFGLPVVPDVVAGYAGPLAGVLTGLEWSAANAPGCTHVASFACDAPFVPTDLVTRMAAALAADGAELACAASGGRSHPVFGLWPLALRDDLRRAMVEEQIRKIDAWTARYRLATVEFAPLRTPAGEVDPFFNTNRPEDLAEAERLLG
jgi:molybdopterin-guanine dinucleotide biosynthesis protein A